MNNTKITSDTLSEKPKPIRFGFFSFKMKPLTLSQIWEMSSLLESVEVSDLNKEINMIAEMLGNPSNIKQTIEISKIMLFRGSIKRKLFGWYIAKHLTMDKYKEMMEYYLQTLQAAFFLISITSLKGIRKIAQPTRMNEAIVLGDSSEE